MPRAEPRPVHEYGLCGNTDHYTDPLNSYLDQVLVRRKGIPISLSIVYLLVAERGLNLSRSAAWHFMVGCYEEHCRSSSTRSTPGSS